MPRCVHGLTIEEPCLKCAMSEPKRERVEASDLTFEFTPHAQGVLEGRLRERARIRAIVLKHLGKEWTGNIVLEEIGE